ncbi:MAG: VanW family protein [bacterium]
MDDIKSLLKGWHPFVTHKLTLNENNNEWCCISDFSTFIKERSGLNEINHNRIYNMKLCCTKIDGLFLDPQEIFSFRRIVGEASKREGYLEGPILIKGKLCFANGGGLCQISTTLFNGALMANMEILEKHNHSVDIWGENRFIALGRDAVYAYALKDLKFRNSLNRKVLIKMEVDEINKRVNCRFFSKGSLSYNITIEASILKEISPKSGVYDPERKKIKLIKGWEVVTTRFVEENGKKKITYRSRDIYKPTVINESIEEEYNCALRP